VKNESAIYIYLLVYYCLKLQATQASLLINENLFFFLEYAGELRIFVSRRRINEKSDTTIRDHPFPIFHLLPYYISNSQNAVGIILTLNIYLHQIPNAHSTIIPRLPTYLYTGSWRCILRSLLLQNSNTVTCRLKSLLLFYSM